MGISDALVIGIFQGIAIIPGISRSGSTILGALWRGLERKLPSVLILTGYTCYRRGRIDRVAGYIRQYWKHRTCGTKYFSDAYSFCIRNFCHKDLY